MSAEQLEAFLERHDLRNTDFAEMVGVTSPAVDHWLSGRRPVPRTVQKLVEYFDKYPERMADF